MLRGGGKSSKGGGIKMGGEFMKSGRINEFEFCVLYHLIARVVLGIFVQHHIQSTSHE